MNQSKMDWLAKKLMQDNYKFRIKESNGLYGTVCMPTGTGKSGVVIEDIINRIKTNRKKCLVINISCPILKLSQQLSNDLFETIKLLNINTKRFRFFINSSDDGVNYNNPLQDLDVDTNYFNDFSLKKNTINIVISCHKSLWKFIKYINDCNDKNMRIINYLDESHLLPIDRWNDDGDDIDTNKRVNLDTLCQKSYAVYALSATPDTVVTNILNKYEPTYITLKRKYLYHLSARDAIQKNGDILPPKVKYMSNLDESEISIQDLVSIMGDAKKDNPDIYHKVLVTCNNSRALLKQLNDSLIKLGYKVFAICSGDESSDVYNEFDVKDIKQFSDNVEQYKGDCFVLHVKILREGIDIKGLTDCVMFSRDHGNEDRYRMVIQTIGRVLRCLKNERGKKFINFKRGEYAIKSNRLKKFGGVYFISSGSNFENVKQIESSIRGLINRYYGFGIEDFSRHLTDKGGLNTYDYIQKSTFSPNEDDDEILNIPEIKKILMKIRCSFIDKYGKVINVTGTTTKQCKDLVKEIKNEIKSVSGSFNTVDWLMDNQVTKLIYEQIPKEFKKIKRFDKNLWEKVIQTYN